MRYWVAVKSVHSHTPDHCPDHHLLWRIRWHIISHIHASLSDTQTYSLFHLPLIKTLYCLTPPTNHNPRFQYAQELLSTFSLDIGEVALQPATGGVFTVDITVAAAPPAQQASSSTDPAGVSNNDKPTPAPTTTTTTTTTTATADIETKTIRLWDRKRDAGFPETKELKRRVRDVIQPGRDLGHVDREYHKKRQQADAAAAAAVKTGGGDSSGTVVKDESGGGISGGVGSAGGGSTTTTCVKTEKGEGCEDCQ
jgi:predicted Rdx family selenoprotein